MAADISWSKIKHCGVDEIVSLTSHFTSGSRSGEYEEVRDQMHTKLLGNGTLLLQHVKEDREGFYLCQADNGIGTGLGKLIQLRVNCK